MNAFNLDNVAPSRAAATLADHVAKPAAYASAIIAKGRDYTGAVCAAINARTEDKPEERRALYRVLHQAATRAGAGFTLASRKHSGLAVVDAPKPDPTGTAPGSNGNPPADASTRKPGSVADKLATMTRALAESEAERVRLVALVAKLEAENAKLRAKLAGAKGDAKPATRVAKPAAPVVAQASA